MGHMYGILAIAGWIAAVIVAILLVIVPGRQSTTDESKDTEVANEP